MEILRLPIGIENFTAMRTEGFYYVDKTGFIRDLVEKGGLVNLFTRPRRFGKSLTMDMCKAFFEIGTDPGLFNGLAISQEPAICAQYMGKYPVISVSLKSVNAMDFPSARRMLASEIAREARRHYFRMDVSRLRPMHQELLTQLANPRMDEDMVVDGLYYLTEILCQYYGQKVILLIDEYDVPLSKASEAGYYPEMVNFIRYLFERALKTNANLQFAVLTGCLRVSKESIFTGLNNLKVDTVTDQPFANYFGFTNDEVRQMLHYYQLDEHYVITKKWYDGYRFGQTEVYCPWDVINWCSVLRDNPRIAPQNFWANVSCNDND